MIRFIVRRVLLMIPSLVGLLILAFLMIRVLPADTAIALAGDNATPEQIQQIREKYALDASIGEQFVNYLGQVARFDFGVSVYSQRPVAEDMAQRLPATLELTFFGLFLATIIGLPLGIIAAVKHNRIPDFIIRFFSVAGIGLATFWLAIMMQLLFTMELRWLPLSGRLTEGIGAPVKVTGFMLIDSLLAWRWDVFWDALAHLLMPASALAIGGIATIARFARAGMLETMQQDFVTYERAAGYPRRRIVWLYALRPSIATAVTQIGLLFGALIAGGVVVETIFNWPGIGTYASQAIFAADYKPMLAVILLVGVVYAVVNIIVDIVLALLDPRIAEQE